LTNLGDATPLDYGGYFVFGDETGIYPPEAELLEPPDDDTDPDAQHARWTVYRVVLEPCTDRDGVLSDNPAHPELPAWFADSLSDIARSMDYPVARLRADLCGAAEIGRAHAYRAIASYHGWENFDSYPLTLTRAETVARLRRHGVK
jgi:hypothetical protein